jgi:hypothetical protein
MQVESLKTSYSIIGITGVFEGDEPKPSRTTSLSVCDNSNIDNSAILAKSFFKVAILGL